MGRLDGRVAIVTGAGRGIGRGIARRFAREGAAVAVAEIDTQAGERTTAEVDALGGQALFVRTDVGDRTQIERAVAAAVTRFGRLDVVVNNAWGGGTLKRLQHKTDDEMLHGIRVAYLAAFWMMQAAFPHLRQRGGAIITLCSLNGVNAHLYTAEYNGGKEAARALTRTAAREWAKHRIRANVITGNTLFVDGGSHLNGVQWDPGLPDE